MENKRIMLKNIKKTFSFFSKKEANPKVIHAPQNLFILLTSECNLRCKHCHMWQNKDTSRRLSLESKIDLIEQFHEINPYGIVTVSGGEIMMMEDEFFAIAKKCRDLNITLIAISNASLIQEEHYERLLLEGPNPIVISLDSHDENINDYIRGVKGSFNQTVKVLSDLAKFKKEHPECKTRILTNSVLFDKNIELIEEYIHFTKKLGIDGISFECLRPTWKNKSQKSNDAFYEKNFFQDKESAIKMLNQIKKEFKDDPFLITKDQDIEWMKVYINSMNFKTSKQVCNSHERNILVDYNGDFSLCGNMHLLNNIPALGNFKEMSLKEFWNNLNTHDARKTMDKCRLDCGLLSCHRNQDVKILRNDE